MQLTAVPVADERESERQYHDAWFAVLEGYEQALTILPPGHAQRAHFLRAYECAQTVLAAVRSQAA